MLKNHITIWQYSLPLLFQHCDTIVLPVPNSHSRDIQLYHTARSTGTTCTCASTSRISCCVYCRRASSDADLWDSLTIILARGPPPQARFVPIDAPLTVHCIDYVIKLLATMFRYCPRKRTKMCRLVAVLSDEYKNRSPRLVLRHFMMPSTH